MNDAPIQCLVIPGTQPVQYCLAGDPGLCFQILRACRLDWDQSLLTVPEIAAATGPGAVVVDCGAFIGDTAELFLKRGCIVYAIEPQADAFALLLHNCPAAICVNRALGERGQRAMATDRISNESPTNLAAREVHLAEAGLPVLALDDLHLARCDFLKIDVEGFEPHVVRGGRQLIQTCRPVIHIEINPVALAAHGFGDFRQLYRMIEELGYEVRGCFYYEREGTDRPWDMLCIPK